MLGYPVGCKVCRYGIDFIDKGLEVRSRSIRYIIIAMVVCQLPFKVFDFSLPKYVANLLFACIHVEASCSEIPFLLVKKFCLKSLDPIEVGGY